MAAVPAWAADLLAQVARDYAREDVPEVRWRRRSGGYVTGSYRGPERTPPHGHLVVRAAQDADEDCVRGLFLHEIAHWLTPEGGHTDSFYATAWPLFERYGDIDLAVRMETDYKATAVKHYARWSKQRQEGV